jgi:hypothetical protein
MSVRALTGACTAAGAVVVGCTVVIRQQTNRNHPVFVAACDQLKQSEVVHHLLGGAEVSTRGAVGGYSDIMGGTAVFRIPLSSSSSSQIIYARVEAEAEWVGKPSQGEDPTPPEQKVHSRWLLRHLEVQPPDLSTSPVVLYSIPAKSLPSPWAPSREPSSVPETLRNLFPNMHTMLRDSDTHRFVLALAIAIAANASAFAYLHRRARSLERASQVMQMLRLPLNDQTLALRTEAMRVAEQVVEYEQLQPVRDGGMYGWQTQDEMFVIAPVISPNMAHDLLLAARRLSDKKWELTHVSLTNQEETRRMLTGGELASTDNLVAAQRAVVDMISAAQSLPLETIPAKSARALDEVTHGQRRRKNGGDSAT